MRQRVVALVSVALLVLTLAGCGSSTGNQPAATQHHPVVIHAILSLTGQGAFLGQEEEQSLQIFQKYINSKGGINGRPVQFAISDDQTSPKVAVQLATNLIGQHVQVILGPTLVGMANAVAALATNGPVVYAVTPGIQPAPHSYVYSASNDTHSLIQALLNYFRSQGWTKIASLTSTDASGQDGLKGIQQAMKLPENSSMHLVDQEYFDVTATSVSSQITKIKNSGAQALLLWTTGTPAGTAFKDIAQGGLNIPVGTTNGNQIYSEMHKYQAFLPAKLYIATSRYVALNTLPAGPAKDVETQFYQALAADNLKPDLPLSIAWDPAAIVVNVLKKLGPDATATQIRDAIDGIRGYEGVAGTYNFSSTDHRGLGLNSVYVTLWNAGKDTWQTVSGPGGAPPAK